MKVDYLVVGAGLTGSTVARLLADRGEDVLVVERRPCIGGNCHDHTHPSGIRVHTYGPHLFRTNSEEVWKFITRFGRFYKYEHEVKTRVDEVVENWPIAGSYIRKHIGEEWKPEFTGKPKNFEEASLSMMPRIIYEKFVKDYTEKQWGTSARKLSPELAKRFDVREDDDPRLKKDKHQGVPVDGYTKLFENMLYGIPVLLNFDYLKRRKAIEAKKIVFTGSIDEFFNYKLGRLKYRALNRMEAYIPHIISYQPHAVINEPLPSVPRIRTFEWKHIMPKEYADQIKGTVITKETPNTLKSQDRYEYPFLDEKNKRLYMKYLKLADKDTIFCGRLGSFSYIDMDVAIERAIDVVEEI